MLSYLIGAGQKTHIIDETTRGGELGPGTTLCGRPVRGGSVEESERIPGCSICARVLRKMQREFDARSEPLKSAPMPLVNDRDFLCPICREPLRLAAKRHSFPTQRVNTVRVTMMLICNNEPGHGEEP
ncbi:hypothetical protein LCGC14_0259440 [marine sediment metagenome]|uniref:Uncharacterized protein n=1 Tax=marine sediment metagenome TaxID=412755 RepID=A0A0F9U7A6_9ZZZZ